ncbi:transporter [Halorussus pelagicus]|uniref:transporter n=1 Tax=Halorussus pelagicus TaxID=2505977 RepID=UPI000FFB8066|nr:transporter [Halorussus pelagicus]
MTTAEDASLTTDGGGRRATLVRGAVAGLGAWMLGYLVTYVSKSQAISEALRGIGFVSQLLGGETIPAWKGVSWLFLNAHVVATKFPTITGGTQTANFVTGEEGSALLLALPVVVLLAAGVVTAYGRPGGAVERAKVGATVALGYLPLSAGVALVATHSVGDTDAAIAADPVTAILLAGAVYPLVLGALGGALSSVAE